MFNKLISIIHKITDAVPRTERELSIALAIYHIISGERDYVTVEEAKEILKDYIHLDETKYSERIRDNHLRTMQKVDWVKVIHKSLTDEIYLKAHSVMAKEKHTNRS
jgi:DNA-directed RNA polymerase subunit F